MSLPEVRSRGQAFFDLGGRRHTRAWKLASTAVLLATGSFVKAVMSGALLKKRTENLDILLEAQKRAKLENRGLLTIMNHSSLLDDPFTWGILPFSHFLNPKYLRWSLGADNVCFSNP